LTEYLDLADYLLIAEAVIGVPAEEIARWPGIGLAESALHAPSAGFEGVELYPDVIDKAAVLCSRLARDHPLPDGNKRVAYLAMLEFLVRKGVEWAPPSVEVTVATIEAVAAGTIRELELAEWLRATSPYPLRRGRRRRGTSTSGKRQLTLLDRLAA
jgi:death on curing protein